MNIKSLLILACAALCFVACDEDTDTLGSSLTSNTDHLEISTDTFEVSTRSILIDSVYARNTTSYLGTVRDPETGEYFTANFMTQFHTLENYNFPELDSIISRDENGMVQADSCELRIFFSGFYGDSLSSMKCAAYELDRPMKQSIRYYSNFDPKKEGLLRKGGVKATSVYSLTDMNIPRANREHSNYSKNIRISLNKPYTDKEGKTYNNYGTYIMRKYYEHPEYFSNSTRLTNNVIHGFYIESTSGIGNIAYATITQLNVYFRFKSKSKSTDKTGMNSYAGTQEVMQRTNFVNNKSTMKKLVDDETCTYLKTPAGIFTEMTLPVEQICGGHVNDTINSAEITLQRIRNSVESKYTYDIPATVLMIPKDSLHSFFENKDIINNKTSFLATYSKTNNTYTFNNIGSLIKAMQHAKESGETSADWNKVVIIPVTTTTNTSKEIIKIVHNMSLSSTRLVGGAKNPNSPIKINVIYSKYK